MKKRPNCSMKRSQINSKKYGFVFTPLKKKSFKNWKLYVITDPDAIGERPLVDVVREAVEGGASEVQGESVVHSCSIAKSPRKISWAPGYVPFSLDELRML